MHPVPTRPAVPVDASARGWAWAGVIAGLLGPAVLLGTAGIYAQEAWDSGDNTALAGSIADHTAVVWAHQAAGFALAALLIVFGLGLRRRLAPAGGLVADVAAAGVLLTAVAVFLGAGLNTELWWAVQPGSTSDPDTVGALLAGYSTIGWLWGGLAVSAAAVAYSGFARGTVGRAVAWASALLAVVVVATQVFPVQYISIVPGGLWLAVIAIWALRRGARSAD